jgi:hypothetical protein
MDENKARRVTDGLRDRGIDAHLATTGVGAHGVRVLLGDGREAMWGDDGSSTLDAEVMLDGVLVGFVPTIPDSAGFTEAQIVEAIAATDYTQPEARHRDAAPSPAAPLTREGGFFRRFLDGFRYR